MSKKQTRRSISVRGVTYDRLRDYCASASISMSDFVEQRIAEFFKDQPYVAPAPVEARPAPIAARPMAAPAPRPAPMPAPARVAVARTEKSPPPPARSLPASSAIALKKPQPTVAMKVSTPVPARAAAGRPAPTPASQVFKTARPKVEDRDDYRAIRF